MLWRLLLFELVAVAVVLGVWFGAPYAGITSVFWRVIIIIGLLLPPIVLIIWNAVKARRASRGLEAGIKEQARAAQEKARPDRREEVGELRDRFSEATAALRKSRIGRGGSALYALPWYMIIGPPAAGKSTALLQSGLKFPFTTGDRKAIKGVGGTRNCDWWFSDQAILLDTAGRYASEDEDLEEWLAFLRLLKKYRRKRPLNGLLVAVSVADVMRASTEEIEELANKLRGRIDQVIEELDLELPVYVLFTKCDLLSGFVQFFGDLSKSARGQVLGFTMPLSGPNTDVDKLFNDEFELLMERLHKRCLSRLASAKSAQRRDVFQFPLQLLAGREALGTLLSHLMQRNPYLECPRLRGVYFCSGTQEGRPFDAVMAMVSRGLGLKELASEAFEQGFQKKSYFLRDVFTQVIFPDKHLAGSTALSLSRRKKLSILAIAASVLISAGLLAPASVTFSNNRKLGAESIEEARGSRVTTPEDPRRVIDGLRALEKLGARLDLLTQYHNGSPPWYLSLGFYQGEKLLAPVERVYLKRMRQAFVLPAGTELEATLIDIASTSGMANNAAAAQDFDLLKTYLMVTDPQRLDVDVVIPVLLTQWKKRLHPDVAQEHELLAANARRYLQLVKSLKARWLDRDKEVVRNAQRSLRARDAEYRALVGDLEGQVRSFSLRDALRGRIQNAISAKYEVPGIYTREAWTQHIEARLAKRMLQSSRNDSWVLGEESSGDRLRDRYYDQFIAAWLKFTKGLSIDAPSTAEDSLRLLEKLTERPPIFNEVFSSIIFNTELPMLGDTQRKLGSELLKSSKLSKINRALEGAKRLGLDKNVPKNAVEKAFLPLKELVAPAGTGGRGAISGLSQYQSQLEAVREALAKQVRGSKPAGGGGGDAAGGGADAGGLDHAVEEAQRVTKGVLATLPGDLRRMLSELFLAPLEIARSKGSEHRSKQQGESFSNELCMQFGDIGGRYPFSRKSTDEAQFQEVARFFSPKQGTVWKYYEEKLKGDLVRKGDVFQPVPGRPLQKGIVAFYNQAWRITRALYPFNSETPQARFQVRPYPAIVEPANAAQVSEISLEVEGKLMTYRNGPPEQWTFTWSGQQDKRTRLVVKGGAGLHQELSFQGDWSLMRLMDKAKVTKRGSWTNVEWTLKGGTIRIPMDIRPDRLYNPLFTSLRLSCH